MLLRAYSLLLRPESRPLAGTILESCWVATSELVVFRFGWCAAVLTGIGHRLRSFRADLQGRGVQMLRAWPWFHYLGHPSLASVVKSCGIQALL